MIDLVSMLVGATGGGGIVAALAGVAVALIRRRERAETTAGLDRRAALAHDSKVAPELMKLIEGFRGDVAKLESQLEKERVERQAEREKDKAECDAHRKADREACDAEIEKRIAEVRADLAVVARRSQRALPDDDTTGRIELERVVRRSRSTPGMPAYQPDTVPEMPAARGRNEET